MNTNENAAQATPETTAPSYASTIPLCNLVLGLLIVAQIPIMFGMVSGEATIGIVPWVLCAYPVIIVCVVRMFKNGELVDATVNGVLSAVLMGQNAILGLIYLAFSANGQPMPETVSAGIAQVSGMAFLAGAVILIPVSWLAFHNSKVAGVCILCAGIGFLSLSAMHYGAGQLFGLVGAIGLTILAVYLLLSGIAMLFPKKQG